MKETKNKRLVADAAPLIFLGKINQLKLLPLLFLGEIFIPSSVKDEQLRPKLAPSEQEIMGSFLKSCEIISIPTTKVLSKALSESDHTVIALAIQKRAQVVLADDRLLRQMVAFFNMRPLGALGVLIKATHQKLLDTKEAKNYVDELIKTHHFRIGIEVYQATLKELGY